MIRDICCIDQLRNLTVYSAHSFSVQVYTRLLLEPGLLGGAAMCATSWYFSEMTCRT